MLGNVRVMGNPDTDCVTAAAVLKTARRALGLPAPTVATAAGCSVTLVEQIESGEHDPVVDTVQRLLTSVGLDLRGGLAPGPYRPYSQVHKSEVRRVAAAWAAACAARAEYGAGPPGPVRELQLPWDGVPPAPPHLFGAGPSRRSGGGWAALVVRRLRSSLGLTAADFARVADLDATALARIESGALRPQLTELQRIHAAADKGLALWIDVYDDHDDGLELDYLRDSEADPC